MKATGKGHWQNSKFNHVFDLLRLTYREYISLSHLREIPLPRMLPWSIATWHRPSLSICSIRPGIIGHIVILGSHWQGARHRLHGIGRLAVGLWR